MMKNKPFIPSRVLSQRLYMRHFGKQTFFRLDFLLLKLILTYPEPFKNKGQKKSLKTTADSET